LAGQSKNAKKKNKAVKTKQKEASKTHGQVNKNRILNKMRNSLFRLPLFPAVF